MPPAPPHRQRKLFTPTKKAIASVLHDTFKWSYAWASKSPGVSPVENVWACLKEQIRKHPRYAVAKTPDNLYLLAKDVWHSPEFVTAGSSIK
ncbi:hypothetical protein DFH09DRAFT_1315283 [Mycena vulgaris]|nr:hypothetical protein DFH09DRAFT_1315283 [Mycena vulgaris]